MLRAVLVIIGIGLIGAAVGAALTGCGLGAVLRLGLPGLILVAALFVERWRYRRLGASDPGPLWTATGERFIDPETGRLVKVYWRPETGERHYQASASDRLAGGAPSGYPPAPGPRSSAG